MYCIYAEHRARHNRIKLTYFDARGRCEAIRILFAAGNLDYDNIRLDGHTEWTSLKPQTPLGTLPLLEAEGQMINQSLAIGRLVAKMCDLAGSNYVTQAQVDGIVDSCADMQEVLLAEVKAARNKQNSQQNQQSQQASCNDLVDKLSGTLKNLDKQLGENDFFVENKLSFADIQFYSSMETAVLSLQQTDILKSYPKLQALYERVASVPEIEDYLASRPITQY